MDLDLDGFLQLHRAQIESAQANAGIAAQIQQTQTAAANVGVDLAAKRAGVDAQTMANALAWEQVVAQQLQNAAKTLDIRWDKEAHANLVKMRQVALRRATIAEEAGRRIELATGRIGRLLSGGGQFEPLRDAYLAFEFFRSMVAGVAALGKIGLLEVPTSVFQIEQWTRDGIHPLPDPKVEAFDLGGLFIWARQHTVVPRLGTPAWLLFSQVLNCLSEAASGTAADLQARAAAQNAAAKELAAIDWARLQQQ